KLTGTIVRESLKRPVNTSAISNASPRGRRRRESFTTRCWSSIRIEPIQARCGVRRTWRNRNFIAMKDSPSLDMQKVTIQMVKTENDFRSSRSMKRRIPMKNKAIAIGVRTRSIYGVLAIMTILLSIGENTMAQTKSTAVVKNIVIVHGGLVDGSGWEAVYNILKKDGY